MFLPLRDDNPVNRIGFQFVTVGLIAACTVVWVVQWLGGDQFDAELVFRLGMIPVTVLGELRREPDMVTITPWLTIVTSMFLHGGFMHLFGNMLYLWISGTTSKTRWATGASRSSICSAERWQPSPTPQSSQPRKSPPSARAVRSPACSAPTSCFIRSEGSGFWSSSCRSASPPGAYSALDRLPSLQRAGRRPGRRWGRLVCSHRRLRCRRAAGGAAAQARRAAVRPRLRAAPEADALPAAARGREPWNGTLGGAARRFRCGSRSRRRRALAGAAPQPAQRRRCAGKPQRPVGATASRPLGAAGVGDECRKKERLLRRPHPRRACIRALARRARSRGARPAPQRPRLPHPGTAGAGPPKTSKPRPAGRLSAVPLTGRERARLCVPPSQSDTPVIALSDLVFVIES